MLADESIAQQLFVGDNSGVVQGDEAPTPIADKDENISDCSDDEEVTHVSFSEITERNATTLLSNAESQYERHKFQRLSSKYLLPVDAHSGGTVDMSDAALRRLDDIIAEFPIPPSHVPQLQETTPPIYSNLSSAAMKAVSFGFGSLRRGVDKLGIFAPKK